MKVVFFGTGSFAVPALRKVAEHVVLVVSQPDRPSGRGLKLKPSEVKQAALELGLSVEAPERARAQEFVDRLRALEPDALLVASYGQILSQGLLDSAKRGGINLHGSILPKYRGAAPIQRCLLAGETETGVTIMQMDKGMDSGDVIEIRRLPIEPEETYGDLQMRLSDLAAEMAGEWMPRIARGDYRAVAQDAAQATYAPKIDRSEAELSFGRSAREEYNRFRAFTPSPGAYIRTGHGNVKVLNAVILEQTAEPGTVLAGGSGCLVGFQDGSLDLLEVQPEGKRPMSGKDFKNGARLRPGDSLR